MEPQHYEKTDEKTIKAYERLRENRSCKGISLISKLLKLHLFLKIKCNH
jgi:hypothetical protein